ncbi:MAG: PEP-CTERM sorting domain-containing protein [Planctomyces sp.]
MPEPGSWALGCIASLAAVFAWRRRQAPATV